MICAVECFVVGVTDLPVYVQTSSEVSVYKPSCISDYAKQAQVSLMKTGLTFAVTARLFAPGRQKFCPHQQNHGSLWSSGTVQAKHNVSMLTTHADVYLTILICKCMLMSTL